MDLKDYRPNRLPVQFSASSTDWNILATDGTGYATYAALLAANKTTYPGTPAQFPTGLPEMSVRSAATGGLTDGSPFLIRTNGLDVPSESEDLISGSGQTYVFKNDAIKQVWVKKTVGTDVIIIGGRF